jgi:serine/threonine protein kinase
MLREEWQRQGTAIKLLQREARAGLTVRHPHLVPIQYAHVTRPPYFLVMDLLPGESLRRRLRRDYRVDLATALWIARQVAEALLALHRAGFLHGDVKPDNIHLVDVGKAILIDLGFTHRLGENAHLRRQGYILGTVNYLAPELCSPDEQPDFRSDVFSLGVTVFEMLTGRFPYPTGTAEETFRRHRSEAAMDIRQFVDGLPATLVQLVGRLLQRRPANRLQASTVVQQLIGLEISAMKRRRSA